jgi:hypothetical protein
VADRARSDHSQRRALYTTSSAVVALCRGSDLFEMQISEAMFHDGAHCLRIQILLTFLGMQEPAYVEATCSIIGHAFRLHPSDMDGCARHRRRRRKSCSAAAAAPGRLSRAWQALVQEAGCRCSLPSTSSSTTQSPGFHLSYVASKSQHKSV